jgi:hypothetical protein
MKITLSVILSFFIKAACGQVYTYGGTGIVRNANDTAWATTLIEKVDTANVFILCSRKTGVLTYTTRGKIVSTTYGLRAELFDNNWKSLTKDTSIIIWDYRKINHQ